MNFFSRLCLLSVLWLLLPNFAQAQNIKSANMPSSLTTMPPPVISGSYGPLCSNATPIALNATPTGGVWSGTGVVGSTFNPTGLNGSYAVTYTTTGGSATINIVVNPAPTISAVTATPANLCGTTTSQLFTPDLNANYIMNINSGVAFVNIGTSGTTVGTVSDDSEHAVTIPSFTFNGVVYTTALLSPNGVVVFGATTGDVAYSNTVLPAGSTNLGSAGTAALLPWWDDLIPLAGNEANTIRTQTVGNLFIIQWSSEDHYSVPGLGVVTYQVQLNLTTGAITYVYNDVVFSGSSPLDNGGSATIGLSFSPTSAIQYSFNTQSLVNGQSITFTPNPPSSGFTYAWSPTGTLNNATIYNPIANGIAATTDYEVRVTSVANSCSATASTRVTFSVQPTAVTSLTGTGCANGLSNVVFTFTGNPPFNFTYTNGTTPVNITGHPSNTYTLVGASAGNYNITALSDVNMCTPLSLGGSATINAVPTTSAYSLCAGAAVSGGLTATLGASSISVSSFTGTTVGKPTYERPYGFSQGGTCSNSGTTTAYSTHAFSVATTGSYTFSMCTSASEWDSYLTLYQGAFNPAGGCAGNTAITANDDFCSGGLSQITVNLTAGINYVLVVAGYGSTTTGAYTLTASPAVLGGSGPPTVEWYTAISGGSAIATGSPFNPVGVVGSGITDTNTPAATTFYAAFPNNSCRMPVVFTVAAPPTATIVAGTPQCGSTPITATSASSITNYIWSNAAGSNTTAATTTNTYTVTVTAASTCTGSTSLLVTPVDCNNIYTGAPTCSNFTVPNVQGNAWFDIFDATGIIARINPNGMNLGNLTVSISDLSAPPTNGTNTFLPRTMDIQCSAYPTGVLPSDYSLKLYYYDSEFDAYKTAISNTTTTIADLGVAWRSGGSGCTIAGYNSTSNGLIGKANVTKVDYGTGGSGFYLGFDLNHFTLFAPTINTGNPLPVKWLTFTGEAQEKANALKWATASEENNAYFEVERSFDALNFEYITKINGAGNSTVTQNYAFNDQNAAVLYQNTVYYRIKQTDFDGKYSFSNTVTIRRTEKEDRIIAFPNPSGTGIFSLSGNKDANSTALLTNVLGQRIAVTILNSTLDLSSMPAGVYFLQIENRVIRLVKS
jgi:hypothetical protein